MLMTLIATMLIRIGRTNKTSSKQCLCNFSFGGKCQTQLHLKCLSQCGRESSQTLMLRTLHQNSKEVALAIPGRPFHSSKKTCHWDQNHYKPILYKKGIHVINLVDVARASWNYLCVWLSQIQSITQGDISDDYVIHVAIHCVSCGRHLRLIYRFKRDTSAFLNDPRWILVNFPWGLMCKSADACASDGLRVGFQIVILNITIEYSEAAHLHFETLLSNDLAIQTSPQKIMKKHRTSRGNIDVCFAVRLKCL